MKIVYPKGVVVVVVNVTAVKTDDGIEIED
ncbi:hypothetical protein RCH18_002946 [Flavobacterium sp. PL11]|jgi:hypothetical protein|nr:hypothetical protein [Flavobacterium sp. PL11]